MKDVKAKAEKSKQPINLCRGQPKSMIKYINMQTSLCPKCKTSNLIRRCSKAHLETCHNVQIDDVYVIMRQVSEFSRVQNQKSNQKRQNNRPSRKDIIEYAEKLIHGSLDKLRHFLANATLLL